MGLLDRVRDRVARTSGTTEQRYSADTYLTDYLMPSTFNFGGSTYPIGLGLSQTYAAKPRAEVANSLPAYLQAVRSSPPAYAAQMVRATILSQVRFTFRNRPTTKATPRRLFGTTELKVLEQPWPNATTGDLVSIMEWHAGLTGNAYVVRQRDRLRVLRPDWVAIVYGSNAEPDDPAGALDGRLLGYVYCNGGFQSGNKPTTLLPEDVAHFAPDPDPLSSGLGMSWVTAALEDIRGDRAMTDHKVLFLRNGATPNLVIKGIPAATQEQFDRIVEGLEANHTGVANAYKTLYLTAGADATVVGADLSQLDFKSTQGSGETRIAMLGRVPAPILGISEGLAGSSLNAGNFGMARRLFADGWIFPTAQNLAGSLSTIVKVPPDAELWFDTADMPILREDAKDAAEIQSIQASAINGLVREGWTPESAIAAVMGQNMTLLKHSGLVSVQLQPPGTTADTTQQPAVAAEPTAKPAAKALPKGPE